MKLYTFFSSGTSHQQLVPALEVEDGILTHSPAIIGPFPFRARPTLADVYLVPQVDSARRFKVDVSR